MPLTSLHEFFRVQPSADTHLGCAGNGSIVREFSPLCSRRIDAGSEYVEWLTLADTGRAVPRVFNVVSRHCAHCALTFFPTVAVSK